MDKRRIKFHQLKPGMLILFTRPSDSGDRSFTDKPIKVREIFEEHIAYDSLVSRQWFPSNSLYSRREMGNRMMLANRKILKAIGQR